MTLPDTILLARVDAEMARHHARGTSPGLCYGVVADGRLVHSGGWGERVVGTGEVPDADTVFRIASMTKSFTAALILLLRDQGRLRLDDPVTMHLPELDPLPLPTTDSPPVTLRQLLTMTAGLPTDDPWGDRQQSLSAEGFDEFLRSGITFAWTPGTVFEYSNLGYALLGRVIEALTGTPYRVALRDRLLTPLGLSATAFEAAEIPPERLARGCRRVDGIWTELPADGYGAFAPMGGLFSSVRDLSAWILGFLDAFPPRNDPPGTHPLNRASRREMQSPQWMIGTETDWPALVRAPASRAIAYGFGLRAVQDSRHGVIVGHSGGYPGFGSHMRWHPQSGRGVVVLANSTYAPTYFAANAALGLLLDDLVGTGHRLQPADRRSSAVSAHRTDQRQAPPNGVPVWPRTLWAKARIDRLLRDWDDAVAAEVFADNVALDEPLSQRRARIDRLRTELGPLTPDDTPLQHLSPAQCRWWLSAPRGRVRVEILMSPHSPALVQSWCLTPIPDPSAQLSAVLKAIVTALNTDGSPWPEDLPTTGNLDRRELTRQLRLTAQYAGPCELGETIGGNGTTRTTAVLNGRHATVSASVTVDPASGAVSDLVLKQDG